jgi:phenylpropionate dioxygenase-like ring-hydroxylating dioxygenase large terminal subunit
MWIENAWYVAAWGQDIAEDALFARTILGIPIVFYRTNDGSLTALEDRCCHRMAPLSKGRLEGDALRCMYHGLKFASSGACIEVPGEERVPANFNVRHFPVAEKQNLVWIWMGDADQADPEEIIDWPYLDDPAWPYKGGYLHYDANYQLIIDNLLDFSHLPYTHENTIGTSNYDEDRPSVEHTPFGVRIENSTNDTPLAPMNQKFADFEGNVDRWSFYDFHLRGNCVLGDFGSAPVGTGGAAGDRQKAMQFRHFSVLTPETDCTVHYHFAHPRNFGIGVDGLNDQIREFIFKAFYEDKDIIEAQQRLVDLNPNDPMMTIAADKALSLVRRQIKRIVTDEQQVTATTE